MRYATLFLKAVSPVFLLWVIYCSQDVMQQSLKVLCQNINNDSFHNCSTYLGQNKIIENPFFAFSIGILSSIVLPESCIAITLIISLVGGGVLRLQDGLPVILGCNMASNFDHTRNILLETPMFSTESGNNLRVSGIILQNVHSLMLSISILTLDILYARVQSSSILEWTMNVLIPTSDENRYSRFTELSTGMSIGVFKLIDTSGPGIGVSMELFLSCFSVLIVGVLCIRGICHVHFSGYVREKLKTYFSLNRNWLRSTKFPFLGFFYGFILQSSDVIHETALRSLYRGWKSAQLSEVYSLVVGANVATTLLPFLAVVNLKALQAWVFYVFVHLFGLLMPLIPLPGSFNLQICIAKFVSFLIQRCGNRDMFVSIVYQIAFFIFIPAILLLFSLVDPIVPLVLVWSSAVYGLCRCSEWNNEEWKGNKDLYSHARQSNNAMVNSHSSKEHSTTIESHNHNERGNNSHSHNELSRKIPIDIQSHDEPTNNVVVEIHNHNERGNSMVIESHSHNEDISNMAIDSKIHDKYSTNMASNNIEASNKHLTNAATNKIRHREQNDVIAIDSHSLRQTPIEAIVTRF